jgi:RNA polymerase sigma-70 factor (ECF subfamily)
MGELSEFQTVPIQGQEHDPDGRPPTAEKVFEEYAPRVYSLARRMLGNAADAEDVTQDVFLNVVRSLPSFRGEAAFSTWLYRIAVNAALAYRRKQAVREEHLAREPLEDFDEDGNHRAPVRPWITDPAKLAIDHEVQRLIEGAIAGLPENYRHVYVLADVEELPNAEIAEMLGLSVAAVKSRLHRARLLMRRALAPYFEEQAA